LKLTIKTSQLKLSKILYLQGKKMHYIDKTFSTPQENIDYDETLLNWCEENPETECLRFWEPSSYFVVLGRSNKPEIETNLSMCQQNNIPIIKRCSGGGTVLQGPGCLNYALILNQKKRNLTNITQTNQTILKAHQEALSPLVGDIQIKGIIDLTLNNLKFSGNAQKRKRHTLLFHGTFLLNFDLDLITKYLAMPSKQPDYREKRSHRDFLISLDTSSQHIKTALKDCWKAHNPCQLIIP
jgi:lipoate-protein ligase A